MSKLYILPFDHRSSFLKIIGIPKPPNKQGIKTAKNYKKLVYHAYLNSLKKTNEINKTNTGILVDPWLGKDILQDAKKKKLIFCYTLEKSGQQEFKFDQPDYKQHLQRLKPTYAKVLVRYNPQEDKTTNKRQAKRLAILSNYLQTTPTKFLFELLVPPTDKQLKRSKSKQSYDKKIRPALTIKAIKELQQTGVNPSIWKLEGTSSLKDLKKITKQVISFNPNSRIIILGRGESKQKAEQWIKVAAQIPEVIGFAVGRTIFQKPLENYKNKKISKTQATTQITNNFLHFIKLFENERKQKMKIPPIYIGSDHAGFKLKEKVKLYLIKKKIPFEDLGNLKFDPKDDYPDFATKVARKVAKEKTKGILLCGSSLGVCISANKIKGIRAVSPYNNKETTLSRTDDDANILCLSGWFTPVFTAFRMINTFLNTEFSKSPRHQRRINKIKKLELK
jgi:RpiB/LacA/LacB family sugar-phosphate isomerase